MPRDYPRDLVGYGAYPPDPRRPREARLALNFVMNYEEGSEYSVPDGDGFSEATLTEAAIWPPSLCSITAAASASGGACGFSGSVPRICHGSILPDTGLSNIHFPVDESQRSRHHGHPRHRSTCGAGGRFADQ